MLSEDERVKAERDTAKSEAKRDADKSERDAAEAKRDTAKSERDAAEAKRDAAEAKRDAAEAKLLEIEKVDSSKLSVEWNRANSIFLYAQGALEYAQGALKSAQHTLDVNQDFINSIQIRRNRSYIEETGILIYRMHHILFSFFTFLCFNYIDEPLAKRAKQLEDIFKSESDILSAWSSSLDCVPIVKDLKTLLACNEYPCFSCIRIKNS